MKKNVQELEQLAWTTIQSDIENNQNALLSTTYIQFYDELPIEKDSILFESRDGEAFIGSPYAMYEFIIRDHRFDHFKIYWVYKDELDLDQLKQNFSDSQRIHFIAYRSEEYLRCLASAQYLINHITFPYFFTKKEGQTYINTWHGTPLKTLGFDIPNDPFNTQNVIRNFLMTDYLISPNHHTSNVMINSYKLNNIYRGTVLETGYPRMDLTINGSKQTALDKLKPFSLNIDDNKETILYTPTWRGSQASKPTINFEQMEAEVARLQEKLGGQYNILLKLHPYAYRVLPEDCHFKDQLIPNTLDINALLPMVDILITDYSSIFFDYLALDRPIIFYSWDQDSYDFERGMYFEQEELPGPVNRTIDDVIHSIHHIDDITKQYQPIAQKMKSQINAYDDGNATERIINTIFFDQTDNSVKLIKSFDKTKKKLLIYPGGMFNNGITSSLINLLNLIDYQEYDVTLLMNNARSQERVQNILLLNKNIRPMYVFGQPLYTLQDRCCNYIISENPTLDTINTYYPQKAYQREIKRLLPTLEFDVAIDFSGYSYYWGKFIAEAPANRKLVFLHNDLASDVNKVVNGEQPHIKTLTGLFLLYPKFDKLLSVSPALSKINQQHLAKYAQKNKFDYVMNTLDIKKILSPDKKAPYKNPITIKQKNLKPIKEIDVPFIIDMENPQQTTTQSITFSNHWFSVAEYDDDNEHYYKVLKDGIYVGWVEKKYFIWDLDQILSEEIINHYAVVSNGSGRLVCSQPYNTSHDLHRVTGLARLQDVIVYIDKKVVTERLSYYHFSINGHPIGWAVTSGFKFIEVENEQEIIDNYQEHREALTALPSLSQELHSFAKINQDNPDIYNKLYGLKGCNLKQISLKQDQSVLIKWKMANNYGNYYQIETLTGETGWISENDITFTNGDDIPMILKQNNRKTDILIKGEDILLFTSVEEIQSFYQDYQEDEYKWRQDHFTQFYTHMNNQAQSIAMIDTKFGKFQQIIIHNKTYFVMNKKTKPIEHNEWTDINNQPLPKFSKDYFNLVTMGRLSPEKNHAELIKSIQLLFEKDDTLKKKLRLYILGDGKLKDSLTQLIKDLRLTKNVFLLGHQPQPFEFIKKCDQFILPSIYEGQPMVLLEMLTLKMPTMATNIPANQYVLGNNKYGYLIKGTSAENIAQAIQDVMMTSTKYQTFNYEQYNRLALQQFYTVVNGQTIQKKWIDLKASLFNRF